MHQTITDQERRTITTAASWLSDVLGDLRHQASNVTRLTRLFQGYHGELSEFMAATRRAWSVVVGKLPELRRPAAYFFRVLEGELSPQVGQTAHQAQEVIYGSA